MQLPKHHYSNYLISVHFHRDFLPDTLAGQIQICIDFMNDLGKLARKNGRKLYSRYGVSRGKNGMHAHFAVSWLPLSSGYKKIAKNGHKRINRFVMIEMLERNHFYVDNPNEAIKRVTCNKKHVTMYVIEQPRDDQMTMFTEFYEHPVLERDYLAEELELYSSRGFFDGFGKAVKRTAKAAPISFVLISLFIFALISVILLSLL